MRISDWSSDVCSSDLVFIDLSDDARHAGASVEDRLCLVLGKRILLLDEQQFALPRREFGQPLALDRIHAADLVERESKRRRGAVVQAERLERSEEHTSELQSLMRISYAVFCLKKNKL